MSHVSCESEVCIASRLGPVVKLRCIIAELQGLKAEQILIHLL